MANSHLDLLDRLADVTPALPDAMTARAQDRAGYGAYALGQVALACFVFGRISAAQEAGVEPDEAEYHEGLQRCIDACAALLLAVGGADQVRELVEELPERPNFAESLAVVPDALALAGVALSAGDAGGADALLKRAACELIAMLDAAQSYTNRIDWSTIDTARAALAASNAFAEGAEAKLKMS